MAPAVPGVEQRSVCSFDGTRLAYQVRGAGPAVVLANGLGGTYTAWRHQYAALGERYRTISWDYRGLFRSGRPADLGTLALPRQVEDLARILDAEEVDDAVLFGWSMGVQFNFEFYRQHRARVRGIVALNGTAGRPFDTAFGIQLGHVVAPLLALGRRASFAVSAGAKVVAAWEGLVPMMQRVGLASRRLDREVFDDIAEEFAGLDFEAYAATLQRLGEHDARDVLPTVDVPVLVIVGTRDLFTPLAVSQRLVRALPDGELLVVDGGTHYTAAEYPALVNAHLLRFLERVWPGR